MMSELRWALLALGVAFFAGLTLWELRRPRQARRRGAAPEPTRPQEPLQLPEIHAFEPLTSRNVPVVELPDDTGTFPVLAAASVGAGKEPAQLAGPAPASGTAAEDDDLPEDEVLEDDERLEEEALLAEELRVSAEPAGGEAPEVREHGERADPGLPAPATPRAEALPELPARSALRVEWPPDELRRVVALRLVAPQPERFAGRSLRQALAAEGFVLGQFDIFHKPDDERRAILSAASLTRPGTFDAETMDSQHYGGLSLFTVLPGPMPPPEAFEELVTAARNLNDRLCGVLQDEGGTPLTPARIASLRERLSAEVSS